MTPRIRSLKPDFFADEDLATVGHSTRLLFVALWTLADREGLLEDRPKRIKAYAFPYEEIEVEPLLAVLAEKEFITRYTNSGRGYIKVVEFEKHQRPGNREPRSEFPKPGDPEAGLSTLKHAQAASEESTSGDSLSLEQTQLEGKGREGKGREAPSSTLVQIPEPDAPSEPTAYDITHRFGVMWTAKYCLPWTPDREAFSSARDLVENQIGAMAKEERAAAFADLPAAMERYLADQSASLTRNRHPFPWFVDRFNSYRTLPHVASAGDAHREKVDRIAARYR